DEERASPDLGAALPDSGVGLDSGEAADLGDAARDLGGLEAAVDARADAAPDAGGDAAADPPAASNILLIIIDDFGVDSANLYRVELGLPATAASTPRIDALATGGLRFSSAWSSPLCSPTRAGLHTGRFAFRTEVGWALGGRELGLSLDETTLPEVVGAQYETALVGKWHLGETEATGGTSSPNEHGWGHYNGVLSGALPDYYAWREVENGVEKGINNEYALSWKVDRAIEWTAAQEAPWLLVLALNAPHKPFHAPDPSLHGLALDTPIGDECPRNEQVACYTAMVEAADTEIGRLLDVVDLDDTTVVVRLQPSAIALPPVVVTDEDPGVTIMRRVIERLPELRPPGPFQARAYMQQTLSNDTSVVSILETVADVSWASDRHSRVLPLALRG
ncbi:MAG: sulfatase-like hydrolase/transferase, partial [Myxococcota bacterium]|nr:sulfatase-like hydrolase/transferase [Myxococcota bacterium]